VAELVDALASGASGFTAVKVRVLSWAPLAHAPPQVRCDTLFSEDLRRGRIGSFAIVNPFLESAP
jgi:predicted nucleic acid-binding protein